MRHLVTTIACRPVSEGRCEGTAYALVYRGTRDAAGDPPAVGTPTHLMQYETSYVRIDGWWFIDVHRSSIVMGAG